MTRIPQPAIEASGLRKTYGDVAAVDGLDLRVEPGSVFGFLGPNGAGKSTTIKILTGVSPPDAGSARILGRDIVHDAVAAKQLLGVVSEEGPIFERLTGAEVLDFVGRMYGLDRAVISARSVELLELFELDTAGSKLVVDYSHGMAKKLAFAAALIHDPKVLFLDEPFEGIDAVSGRLIKSILGRLASAGVTVFLTSHILEIVERLCEEIAVIDHGRIIARGTLDDLQQRAGATASLEQLFLDLVGRGDHDDRSLSWLR